MNKAILVIDMQNVCVGEDHADFFNYDNELVDKVNEIIEANKEGKIVYIRNIMKNNLINKFAPFKAYDGTTEIELVSSLNVVSDTIFDKYVGDAFSNEQLDRFLKENNIDTIEVIGVDGGGCVALTALGAIKKGYKVVINTYGIGTMFEKNKSKYYKKLALKRAEII